MYSVTEDYLSQISADSREFSVSVTLNNTTELTGATIQDITFEEMVNSKDELTLGCACSNKLTINLINPPLDINYSTSFLTAKVGLKVNNSFEYIPLGKFYVTEVSTTNDFKSLKLVAHDGFCKITENYVTELSGDVTLQAFYDEIKAQLLDTYGITLKDKETPEFSLTMPQLSNVTHIQAIGYLAGCLGGFARFDKNGELEITTYEKTNVVIDGSAQYMNGFKRTTGKDLTVASITTGTKENPIVSSKGVRGLNINFENPYITQEIADAIFGKLVDLTFTPCEIQWRGNPAIQAGDIVLANDKNNSGHNVLIMSQTLKISGGLKSTIYCKGKNEIKTEFSTKFETMSEKIDRVYNTLEQAILNATNLITGNNGGYVVMHDTDNDNNPDEILILDTPRIEDARNVWRWNKGGLGHSKNGYNGTYSLAMTMDGQINADVITTGTLNAQRIAVENFDAENPTKITEYIRFGDGTITLGKGDSAITLKLENDKVAFYSGETVIAYFSNNSFEIDNITEGKIRFQNFGYIPRASGNLTFTKLQ